MEFALKTAFINTFPTQPASPATCVPPSTCHSLSLLSGTGRAARWSRPGVPKRPCRAGLWPEGQGGGSSGTSPLAESTPGSSLGRCPGYLLPAPHPLRQARATCGCFSCHTPHPRYQPVRPLSPAPDRCGPGLPGLPQASDSLAVKEGGAGPGLRLPGTQEAQSPGQGFNLPTESPCSRRWRSSKERIEWSLSIS